MNMENDVIIIGRPWAGAVGQGEGARLHIEPYEGADTLKYMIFLNEPRYTEINDFRHGELKVRLFVEDDSMFMLMKNGGQNWFDLPYEPRLEPLFTLTDVDDGEAYAFHTILADVPSGIIKSLRITSLSTEFSRIFKHTIDDLNTKRAGFLADEYVRKVQRIRNRYTPRQMVNKAIIGFEIK